jgi:hypothetical protein
MRLYPAIVAGSCSTGWLRCRRHVRLEDEDASVGVVIARIAFLGEGNGHGSRFSTISVPLQSWLPHSVRHWDRAERW